MDPSKSKGGSSASKDHGRGSRPIPLQIQSQPAPYIPQISQQPAQYYPQMTSPPYYQHQYYPQPPPMNSNQYTVTSDFNPFDDYRDGPSRREPSVERDLPLYDLDDEDDVIPKTQPPTSIENEEDDVIPETQPPKRKHPNKAEKKSWTPVEEAALAKARVQILTCRVVGNEQSRNGFWKRILEHFKKNVEDTTRTFHGLNTKWKNMHGEMGVFNGLFIQQNRLRESGCSDVDVKKNALADYKKKTSKTFTHMEAWEIVRQEAKWLEQPDVSQGSSSHSDKRRKSSESDHYETASNDNTVIPNLNDDTMPPIPKKRQKGQNRVVEDQ